MNIYIYYLYIYWLVVWHIYVEYLLIYMRNCCSICFLASFICISWIAVDLSKFALPCQIDASLTLCNGEDKHHRIINGASRNIINMIVVAKYHDINHSGYVFSLTLWYRSFWVWALSNTMTSIILNMDSVGERRHHIVTLPLVGQAYSQIDPWDGTGDKA